ncbi:MAG: hypothetical protein PW845_29195 [Pseudomonas sp.]|nr:hypothetical protein [Pseudomonas sp.]
MATDTDASVRAELAKTVFGPFASQSTDEIRLLLAGDPDDAVKHAIVACLSLPFGTPAYSAAVVARLRESGVKNLVDTLSAVKGAAMS